MQVSIEREFIFPNSKQANRGQIMSGTDDTNSGTRFVRGRTCDMLVPLYMLKLSAVAYFYRHKEAYSDWTTARFTFFIRVDYTSSFLLGDPASGWIMKSLKDLKLQMVINPLVYSPNMFWHFKDILRMVESESLSEPKTNCVSGVERLTHHCCKYGHGGYLRGIPVVLGNELGWMLAKLTPLGCGWKWPLELPLYPLSMWYFGSGSSSCFLGAEWVKRSTLFFRCKGNSRNSPQFLRELGGRNHILDTRYQATVLPTLPKGCVVYYRSRDTLYM